MHQIFLAVEHMHSHGVVHRDLKVRIIADPCTCTSVYGLNVLCKYSTSKHVQVSWIM